MSLLVLFGIFWLLVVLPDVLVYLFVGLLMATIWLFFFLAFLCWFLASLCFPRSVSRPPWRELFNWNSATKKTKNPPAGRFFIY